MRRTKKPYRWLPGALAVCAVAGCRDVPIVTPTGPARTVGALTTRPIRFATDDYYLRPTVVSAEEGWLQVPASREAPAGRSVQVHFIRFRSTSPRPGPPIVYLAGGPPGSGTYSAAGDRFDLFMRLREVADVIALDQRGTFLVDPAPRCPGTWSYPLDEPWSEARLRRVLAPYLARCRERWSDSVDVAAFNTCESAEDLEALRRALGAEQLNLWGISYGTHLALTYLRLHPDRVHRAILAGVEGPDQTWKLPSNVERVLRSVDSAAARDGRGSHRLPHLADSLRAVLGRLAAQPATVEVKGRSGGRRRVVVGAEDLRRAVYYNLGEREDIEGLVRRLRPILSGDYARLGQFALRTRLRNSESVMALSTDCSAGASPGRRRRIAEEAPRTTLGDIANADLRARCAGWPVPELDPASHAPVRSDVPVLLIAGTLDPRTPPENLAAVEPGLRSARRLTLVGASHDDDLFLSSPRIAEAMVAFLRTGDPGVERIELGPLSF